MRESRIRLLVVHARYATRLSYNDDWFDAFGKYPAFATRTVDVAAAGAAAALRAAVADVDAIVLLHSTNGDTTGYLEPYAGLLANRRVPLISFVGNEVNLPGSPIAAKRRLFQRIRPDWVASQLLEPAARFLFGDVVEKSVVSIPHALNPDVFRPRGDLGDRAIDIGVRATRYPPHLGDDDRNRLLDAFAGLSAPGGLKVDVSDKRLDRASWSEFLNRCRGTISSEAGSWFLERDDATVNAIRAYVRATSKGTLIVANDSALRKLGHKLPWPVRTALRRALRFGPIRHEALVNEQLAFEGIYQRFFSGRPRAPVYGKCISSRHFEAIGAKTCQILLRGRFNDILEADRHYIALKQDFSDLGEVLRRFSDLSVRRAVADAAHAHVMASHTYAHRLRQVESLLNGAAAAHA